MASGVDRISALPDDVLHHVLGFLPAQDVVQTCVLARRWRGVWRSVTSLRFTGANGWGSNDRFAQFVDHLLLHLWCAGGLDAPLDTCDFDFDSDGFMQSPANEQHAGRWIHQLVSRVRALRIRVVEDFMEPSPLFQDLHPVSQHLTRLELIGVGVNDKVVDFSGCPALVELNMEDCDVFLQKILSPSLKHLRIARCYASEYYRILMSLPALVSLELIQFHRGRVPLLERLPQLDRAIVVLNEECNDQCYQDRFDGCGDESETCDGCYYYYGDPEYPQSEPFYDRNNSIFLKGLSEATCLELSAEYDVIVFNRDLRWCPTFTKLKTLFLNDWCLAAHHNALICFLQHAPILEKLTIKLSKTPPRVIETEGVYKPLGQSVASDRLKMVEIRCANVDMRVHKILSVLTTYGIPLEKINIQHTSRIPGSECFNFVCTGFS
ncbi:hypothetical protein QYE76_070992 [Lolium multiflorum]|uniref:F-box domain-containing protein n=1 Tax=Lolium multiflorum TaxID=4521 RepID=A0AAD8SL82_LOLMU|nr:hypothetical protein QYE76_070992 [Lolium multiflorum]